RSALARERHRDPSRACGYFATAGSSGGAARKSTTSPAIARMPLGDDWVAAPTAALLYQFREVCLRGRPTRVAHFDQPRFTWR
ncbi:MAG TPA: hypothetical protein PLT38_00550, partial [Rubrivivax sp.]|nr:hypothetical protein [Rubrivivax sp.]